MEKDIRQGSPNQTMEKDAKHGDHNQAVEKDAKHGCNDQAMAKVKEQWSKLTQEDLERTEGKLEKLTTLIKEKYSENQDKIKEKLNKLGIVS